VYAGPSRTSKANIECIVIQQVRQEKVDLENQLEKEQEYIVNKLQKQLSQVNLAIITMCTYITFAKKLQLYACCTLHAFGYCY
jgi:restriction endonuclease Mrr